MEWFRATSSAVPSQASISSDVGSIFGNTDVSTGLGWGVELLHEGHAMAGHAGFVAEYEEGEDIPLQHWAIIGFPHKPKELRKQDPTIGT